MNSEAKKTFQQQLSSKKAWAILIGYVVVMVGVALLLRKYVDRENLRALVQENGSLGIWLFLLVEYIYVVLVPVYNTPIHLAAGYIFGGNMGWLLNFISTTAGLFTIVALVRYYGRPILRKVVSPAIFERYDKFAENISPIALFIVYVLPLFPDDEITYMLAAGGRIRFWRFILPILLGNVTKAAVSYIGDEGSAGVDTALGTRVVVFIVGVLIIGLQEYLVHRSPSEPNVLEEKEL